MIYADEHFNAGRNANGITADGVLSHPSFKDCNPFSPSRLALRCLLPVKLGQCVVKRLRPTIDVIVSDFFRNVPQNGTDEVILVGTPHAHCDNIERNLYSAFQFRYGLIEVQDVAGSEALGQSYDSPPFETGTFRCSEHAPGFQDGNQLRGA